MGSAFPPVGIWFRRPNGAMFEVVAVDEDEATIEVQYFDGTIDEIDFDAWPGMMLLEVRAPEDWSGSLDMDPEDFTGADGDDMPAGFHDPMDYLDS